MMDEGNRHSGLRLPYQQQAILFQTNATRCLRIGQIFVYTAQRPSVPVYQRMKPKHDTQQLHCQHVRTVPAVGVGTLVGQHRLQVAGPFSAIYLKIKGNEDPFEKRERYRRRRAAQEQATIGQYLCLAPHCHPYQPQQSPAKPQQHKANACHIHPPDKIADGPSLGGGFHLLQAHGESG